MPRNITFYIGLQHKNFKDKIDRELKKLDQKDVDYTIFERKGKLLPTLCLDGYCVAGLDNIIRQLNDVFSRE